MPSPPRPRGSEPLLSLRSPKLTPTTNGRRPTPGSRYYAGYDVGFVADLIRYLALPTSSRIIDPWNGAGTTTLVASGLGHRALGLDINPAAVVVAKSKLLGPDVAESLDALTMDILGRAAGEHLSNDADPLQQWFTAGTARHFRRIERSIQHLLVHPAETLTFIDATTLDRLSSLAASFYVVLFEVIRSFIHPYTTSNPTWIRVPPKGGKLISVSREPIEARFRSFERRHHQRLHRLDLEHHHDPEKVAQIGLGSSTALRMKARSMDACITSPPYCTRIDYAVLTRPELAVLGMGNEDPSFRTLRETIIGTPVMMAERPDMRGEWGAVVCEFLEAVKTHPSKASETYYLRFFFQYFEQMFRSLKELKRVLKKGGRCALVVQDSFYKDIHNDLAGSLTDMAELMGWRTVERFDFIVPHSRAWMHGTSPRYRASVQPTESLLILAA